MIVIKWSGDKKQFRLVVNAVTAMVVEVLGQDMAGDPCWTRVNQGYEVDEVLRRALLITQRALGEDGDGRVILHKDGSDSMAVNLGAW